VCFKETVVHIYQSAQHELNTHCHDNLNPLHTAVLVDPTFQIWLTVWYIEQAPSTICTPHSLHLGPVAIIFTLPISSAICWYLEKPCVLAGSLSVWWKSLEKPCSNVNNENQSAKWWAVQINASGNGYIPISLEFSWNLIQGCIQKFQDSTCKKKFAYLGC